MKTLRLFLSSLVLVTAAQAQTPPSPADALKLLYPSYNSAKSAAQWTCDLKGGNGFSCSGQNSTVMVETLLEAEVWEEESPKTYLVTSAVPVGEYDCHACAPSIGVAVFTWTGDKWKLEISNRAVGFYGGWGDAPDVSIEKIGPQRYGIALSGSDEGQGYASSYVKLLVPFQDTIAEAWAIDDEQDDYGAYDPTDKFAQHTRYRSAAAYRFDPDINAEKPQEYWDIELISRGTDMQNRSVALQQENWTERYRFVDGKYKLIKRTNFAEIKRPSKSK